MTESWLTVQHGYQIRWRGRRPRFVNKDHPGVDKRRVVFENFGELPSPILNRYSPESFTSRLLAPSFPPSHHLMKIDRIRTSSNQRGGTNIGKNWEWALASAVEHCENLYSMGSDDNDER